MANLPRQTKRRELVKRLRQLGFSGPHSGVGDHPEFMSRGTDVLKLPNTHAGDIRVRLLKKLLTEAGISNNEWTGEEVDDDSDESDDDNHDDQQRQEE